MKKILIANRGEIALRIIRSAREMGIKTVAIFSEADRKAPFVRMANESVCIGPPPSNESYLQMDKILQVAKERKVEGIHPGYGFLSENSTFSKKVKNAGLTFIGPPASSMDTMGNKLKAKAAVKKYNIPLLPGTDKPLDNIKEAQKIATDIGFPVLIKAAAGGGGKGMRIVNKKEELKEQLERAISEAESSFGTGAVFLEKYIASPRHIEIQVLSDSHGNHLYLFERECSIQRRHQKVIEEAPSSVLTPELRKKMGESAVGVAKACDYTGAGTVEFLVDENRNHYFLEMNTRLQVEHPVTEMITGMDLVKEQIGIANGNPIPCKQKELTFKGHAIELRLYAENPANKFLPDTGTLSTFKQADGPGVRVDSGFEEGMEIPVYYDPMIAKLIVYEQTRDRAIQRMIRAINDFQLEGVKNTLDFGKFVMNHKAFQTGEYNTHFVDNYYNPEKLQQHYKEEAQIASIMAAGILNEEKRRKKKLLDNQNQNQAWKKNRKELR